MKKSSRLNLLSIAAAITGSQKIPIGNLTDLQAADIILSLLDGVFEVADLSHEWGDSIQDHFFGDGQYRQSKKSHVFPETVTPQTVTHHNKLKLSSNYKLPGTPGHVVRDRRLLVDPVGCHLLYTQLISVPPKKRKKYETLPESSYLHVEIMTREKLAQLIRSEGITIVRGAFQWIAGIHKYVVGALSVHHCNALKQQSQFGSLVGLLVVQ